MKLKRIVAAMVLSMSATVAFAGQYSDVQDALKAKDMVKAEMLLNQKIAENPNAAKAHYLLAQIYEKQGKTNKAARSLQSALDADPSKRFASSGQADKMAKRLGLVSEAPKKNYAQSYERPSAPAQTSSRTYSGYPSSTPTPSGPVASSYPTTTPVEVAASKSSGGGGGFLLFLLGVGILGGVGYGAYYFIQKKNRANELEALDAERRNLLAGAVEMQERVSDLLKKVRYEGKESSHVGAKVAAISSSINTLVGLLTARATANFRAGELRNSKLALLQRLEEAETLVHSGKFDAPAAPQPSPTVRQTTFASESQRTSTPRSTGGFGGYTPAPQRAPEPVREVHHHHHTTVSGGGGDLATGVVLGSILNDNSARERELERQLEREREERRDAERREREAEREAERERERAREAEREAASRNTFDFGGDDNSGGFDLGGRDDDDDRKRSSSSRSDDSFDFGGKDDD